MAISDQLNLLSNTKQSIKEAIINKGGSAGDVFSTYAPAPINYFLIRNIGVSSLTSYNFSNMGKQWGIEDPNEPLSVGARQSLIDSLITYSYDRATAGMPTCTIDLEHYVRASLTEEEIAQITLKDLQLVNYGNYCR